MKTLPLLTAALMTCGLVTSTSGVDWPAWGGSDPGRNMYSPARGLPDQFDAGKPKPGSDEIDLKTTKNVKWVVKLGSQSYANPVVSGGKVFVGTNNESPRDKKHVGDRSVLYAFDEKSGIFSVLVKLKSGKVNDWENSAFLLARLRANILPVTQPVRSAVSTSMDGRRQRWSLQGRRKHGARYR
jgi:hypothetical protein